MKRVKKQRIIETSEISIFSSSFATSLNSVNNKYSGFANAITPKSGVDTGLNLLLNITNHIKIKEDHLEVQEAIVKRKSIRRYLDKAIPEDKLQKVLEAARMAPSGANSQLWKFVVVRDPEKRKQLSKAANGQAHVAGAAAVIAGVSISPERIMMCGVPAYPVDLAIALDHITLAAIDQGLGTCWIGAFNQEEARKVMGIPSKCMIVCLMTIGYPDDEGRPKTRKTLKEVVCYDTFSE
jgi:nitroreductase